MCIFVCFVSRVRVCMVRTLTPFIHMYNPFCDVNGDVLSNIMQFLEPIQVLVSICKFRVIVHPQVVYLSIFVNRVYAMMACGDGTVIK